MTAKRFSLGEIARKEIRDLALPAVARQMGAGQEPKQTEKPDTQHAALREGEQGKPSRPRRPSESLEAGIPIAAAPAAEQSAAAAGSFEE